MAKSSVGYKYQSITNIYVVLTDSYQDVATGAADDSDVFVLTVTNDDASIGTLTIAVSDGVDIKIEQVEVLANAGFANSVPAVELIKDEVIPGLTSDEHGNFFFRLKAGRKLRMKRDNNSSLVVIGHQMNF